MMAVALLGALAGVGLLLVWRAMTRRPTLAEIATTLGTPGRAVRSVAVDGDRSVESRLARRAVGLVAGLGMDPGRRSADLRVTERSAEQHAARQLLGALAGIALAVLLGGGLLGLDPVPTLVVAVLLAGGGLIVPERSLSREAVAARAAWRHALGAYFDLVTVMEAAGAGPETALQRAAEAGEGAAFREIRSTLAAAERTRRSGWSALADLGAGLAVPELSELAASLTLVEHEGARIRRSLEAKADAMRAEQLADAKAEAGATTEKLSIPVVLLLIAFLVFIAYPAAARIGQIGGGP
jgi:hypothetical protein